MKRFNNILAYAQTSLRQQPAVAQATELALHNQAKLTLVSVIEDYELLPDPDDDLPDAVAMALEQGTRERLERIAEPVRAAGVDVNLQVLWGKASIELTKAVLRQNFDLVLKTAEGKRAFRQMLFGTTAMQLFRKCPCPVWVVKPDVDGELKRIAVAVDVGHQKTSPGFNQTLMELGTSLSSHYGSELHLIHAWDIYGKEMLRQHFSKADYNTMMTETSQARQQLLDELCIKTPQDQITKTHLIHGEINKIIPEFVVEEDIDLLIMGTLGRVGTLGLMIGNTAENLLHSVECSVLTVKPQGFQSPIQA